MKKKRGVFEKELGSGIWWIQYFDSDGRRRREKVGSKSDAIKLVENRRTDARRGVKMPENFRAKPVTFKELAEDALAWSRAYKKSFIDDKVRMQPLIAEFGDRPAEQITAGDFRKWLDSKAAYWSVATQNRYCALLKMVYRQAEEYQKIKVNPGRLVKQKREHNECIVEISTAEELRLRAVIEKSYSEHVAEFEIGLQTGMRQSEQFDLTTWERVHLDAGEIRLPDSKSGKARIVHLNARAKAVLRMLHELSLGTGRVFFLNKEPRWFEKALANAGFNRHARRKERVTWHSLRHTFISRLVRAGVDLKTVQELAGHSDIKMTARYAHLAPGQAKAAVEKMTSATITATTAMQAPKQVAPRVEQVQ